MATVYVKESCGVGREAGGITYLSRGEPYDGSHPLVRARPELFAADPPDAAGRRGVERATRAPGERRAAPRRKD